MISRAEIVERARRHLGHREVTPNRSPLIDGWVRSCGLDPAAGHPWCAAFASWCVGLEPGIAGALRLGRHFPLCVTPIPGDLMFFPTDAKGSGHVGVIEDVGVHQLLCIEGNSENGIRRTRRFASEVRCARVREADDSIEWANAPLVRVQKAGTQ